MTTTNECRFQMLISAHEPPYELRYNQVYTDVPLYIPFL